MRNAPNGLTLLLSCLWAHHLVGIGAGSAEERIGLTSKKAQAQNRKCFHSPETDTLGSCAEDDCSGAQGEMAKGEGGKKTA